MIRRVLWLLMLCGAPAWAAVEEKEQLAGEKEEPKTQARPTEAAADEAGPTQLTKSSKPLQPSFELPEFVVTGGGSRKVSAARPELGTWMDTSGGIKASPSEKGASKDQLGAQAPKQVLDKLTETAVPAYGQARLLYGAANTLHADAFYGREFEDWHLFGAASHASSDGGPVQPSYTLNQSSRSSAELRAGMDLYGGKLSADLKGQWRSRLWTLNPAPAPRMDRSWTTAGLSYQAPPSKELRYSLRLSNDKAFAILPGIGTHYTEGLLKLSGEGERDIFTKRSRTQVKGEAYIAEFCQNNGSRLPYLFGVSLLSRFQPWPGATLGLGLSLDGMVRDVDGLLVAPRAEFEQRLGSGLGFWARFRPRLELPSLQALFEKDPALPSPTAKPSRDRYHVEAGLTVNFPKNIALEVKGLARHNEDASLLDDPLLSGVWTTKNVREMRVLGASATLRVPLEESFRLALSGSYTKTELPEDPSLVASFAPEVRGRAALEFSEGDWAGALHADYTGERQARLMGNAGLPTQIDLGASAQWEFIEHWRLLAEAGNLMGQKVQEFPGYPEPAPYVGAGLAVEF